MNTSFADDKQFAWDATSISSSQRCMRYYYYNIVMGYQPKNKSVHLEFGGWFASGLERFHQDLATGTEYEQAVINMVRRALMDTWNHGKDPDGNPVKGTGVPWVAMDRFGVEEKGKSRENLIRTLIWYVTEFKDDDLETYVDSNGVPAVEHTFKLPVDNDVIFCGHLDRLAVKDDAFFVTDNKTTKAGLAPYYYEQFATDGQMSMYTFAGKSIFSVPVRGVIIDAAQIMVSFTRFGRSPTFRTDAQLTEWYDNTMYHIDHVRYLSGEGYFPMNLASCGNYGGCPFRSVCGRDPAVRPNVLKTDFAIRIWDPLVER